MKTGGRSYVVAAALFVALVSLRGTACAEEAYAKWFKYTPDIERAWIVIGDQHNPMRLSIRPKHPTGLLKRVLVLYPRPSSAYDIAISAILRDFSAKGVNAEFTVINFGLIDSDGFRAVEAAETEATDLVFSMGSETSAWLYSHYKGGVIPVVTVCSKDPVQLKQVKDYDSGSGTNIAYTSLNVPIEVQMAYVNELRPNLKNLAILVDKQNVSAVQTQAEPVAAFAKQRGVNVIWAEVSDPKSARAELERMIPLTVEKMRKTDPNLGNSLFWLTGSTSVFKEIDTINAFSGRVPVISVVPEIVGEGASTAALGIGVSFDSNARLAAIYGERILAGQRPAEMKVGVVSPPDVAISFLKTRQIGMRVPFNFFEIASSVYDYNGKPVRQVKTEILSN